MSFSGFTALYHGNCEACSGPIVPGQEAAYNLRDDLVHVECPPDLFELSAREMRCPSCFLVHAGECF
jgi:hypothetical protein